MNILIQQCHLLKKFQEDGTRKQAKYFVEALKLKDKHPYYVVRRITFNKNAIIAITSKICIRLPA